MEVTSYKSPGCKKRGVQFAEGGKWKSTRGKGGVRHFQERPCESGG